jgi:hypothetical protein
MATYVDWTDYTVTFLGNAIAQADFPRAAMRASAVIDALTFDQAAAVILADTDDVTIDRIKMATCAVAEEYQRLDLVNGGSGKIASEKVGNHSVTYVTGADDAKSQMETLRDVAKLYLASTGLMYGGPEISTETA